MRHTFDGAGDVCVDRRDAVGHGPLGLVIRRSHRTDAPVIREPLLAGICGTFAPRRELVNPAPSQSTSPARCLANRPSFAVYSANCSSSTNVPRQCFTATMLRCLLVFVCLPAAVKATYYVYFHYPFHQPPYAHYVYFFGLSQFLKFLVGLVVAGYKINAAGYLPCKHAPKSRAVTRDGEEHVQYFDGTYPPEVQRIFDDLSQHRDFVIGALPPPLVYTLEARVTRARPTQTGANWSPRPWRARKSSRRSTGPSSSRRSKS